MFLITTILNPNAIIVLVISAVGIGGMAWASFGVNQLDIGSGVYLIYSLDFLVLLIYSLY
jgi:hypothetical protein